MGDTVSTIEFAQLFFSQEKSNLWNLIKNKYFYKNIKILLTKYQIISEKL